jgi:hypothetical protein
MEVTKWLKPSITQSATGFNERRALWLQVCGARDGLRGSQALPWVGSYHRNDRHGEQRRPEPKPLLLGIGL